MEVKRKNRIFTAGIIIIAAIIVIFLVFIRVEYNKPKTLSSSTILNKIADMKSNSGILVLKKDDINEALSFYLKDGVKKGNVNIKDAYTDISNGYITIVTLTSYKGLNFVISCKGNLYYKDGNIIFNPVSFKVGKIAVPKAFVMSKLKSFENDKIKVSNDIKFDISKYPVNVVSLNIEEDMLILKMKGLTINNLLSQTSIAPNKSILNGTTGKNASQITKQNNISASNNIANKEKVLIITEKQKTMNLVKSKLKTTSSMINISKGKSIISILQNVASELIKNPSYNYKKEESNVIAMYKSLPPGDKGTVKQAVLKNFDMKLIMKLLTEFGL